MKLFTLPNVLLIASGGCIILAISLSGGSLSKSIKWNLYNSGTSYGDPNGQVFRIYAYQNLWTSFDAYVNTNDPAQAYELIKKDSWRVLPRLLIMATLGIGCTSLSVLLPASLVPYLNRKGFVLNSCRIASSVLSLAAGSILGYTLNYYKNKYKLMLAPVFYDPKSFYPDEDNLSTGFYMAATACVLFFISTIVNIVNVVVHIKNGKSIVKPTEELPAEAEEEMDRKDPENDSAISVQIKISKK
ncbi:unnamed protein product [Mytilus coruscus]|uniref:Uncharacterized protein n=1 Tax=Mytilus coruscus TaxID=42192 RepID=A0A6J8CGJ2_MYTCO|nr:unnamed protein product [Mytilus coruscus]